MTNANPQLAGASWAPPPEVDEYSLIRSLGRGAMGEVFLAHDRLLDRRVAIKFIAADQPSLELRRQILAEARAIARLQHPNVIAVHRVGEVQARPYLVSEFVPGKCLADISMPLPWPRALELGLDMARGLAAAHRQGVLHRDIKPQNVLVSEETGTAKLLDFGQAQLSAETAVVRSSSAGTPLYFAPELFRGEPATPRTDVYALGVVLYELLAGAPPHSATRRDALAFRVINQDAPGLAQAVPGVDPRLAAIVERALSRTASQRFADGDLLREALEELRAACSGSRSALLQGDPYRGLSCFRAEHRSSFFGRDSEARAVVERLRTEPMVWVAGDSGVGKSSLCHAGVAPRIESGEWNDGRRWTTRTFTPGATPMLALADALATVLDQSTEHVEIELSTDPASIGRALRGAQGRSAGLLLVIDQLEELLTLGDPETAATFMSSIVELLPLASGLRVLGTVRTDFISRMAPLPGLGDQLGRILHILRPLSSAAMREAIVGPARAHGFSFEPEALALLEDAARAHASLPLLQFALAEIWLRRDRERRTIPLDAIQVSGGVAGALARHADAVLAALTPPQRTAARTLLLDHVSSSGTRSRKRVSELALWSPDARAALDALVRGRLLGTTEIEGETAYELAHDALIDGWATLGAWIAADDDARVARERLSHAAREWERVSRSSDVLWSERQLDELGRGEHPWLGERESAFVRASRFAIRRRVVARWSLVLAVPLALAAGYGGFRLSAQRALDLRIDGYRATATRSAVTIAERSSRLEERRRAAFAAFDTGDAEAGEVAWAEAREVSSALEKAHGAAATALETALMLDPHRRDLRRAFAEVLYGRAILAEDGHNLDLRDELLHRLALYDDGSVLGARFVEPAQLVWRVEPADTRAMLQRESASANGRVTSGEPEALAPGTTTLAPGSYRATLTSTGGTEVRVPFTLARGERLNLSITMPERVPPGFVYVPRGRFLYGSAEDEGLRKQFLSAVPIHAVELDAYLMSAHETTFGEWITFLESLPATERAGRTPRVAARGFHGSLELLAPSEGQRSWVIHIQPTSAAYTAAAGAPIRYGKRAARVEQDWLRFPVAGIALDDARAYAAWLDTSGRVPGARLCTEQEWERAARGADARHYPHGDRLEPADANYDESYGKDPLGFGPDVVGSHPASDSPFGVHDLAGNVWEWTLTGGPSPTGVARGGAYYHDKLGAGSTNRLTPEPTLRDLTLGLRVCAAVR